MGSFSRLDGDGLAEYIHWKSWANREFGVCSPSEERYFREELRVCGLAELSGRRVHEVGFGNGSFAAWASREGANYTGAEVIPELLERARIAGFVVYDSTAGFDAFAAPASLDALIAFDCLEHWRISDLCSYLSGVRDFLKPDGKVIARVPSGDSPFSRMIQYGDLTHQSILGSGAVRQLALSTGYDVVQVRESVLPTRGLGIKSLIRRTGVKLARRSVFWFLRQAIMCSSSAVLTPNMIFVLRKRGGEAAVCSDG